MLLKHYTSNRKKSIDTVRHPSKKRANLSDAVDRVTSDQWTPKGYLQFSNGLLFEVKKIYIKVSLPKDNYLKGMIELSFFCSHRLKRVQYNHYISLDVKNIFCGHRLKHYILLLNSLDVKNVSLYK